MAGSEDSSNKPSNSGRKRCLLGGGSGTSGGVAVSACKKEVLKTRFTAQ